jgi:ComF family protein
VQNVKNTMIDALLSQIAPHLCCSCGKIGALLCENCKYNIIDEAIGDCIACGRSADERGICKDCRAPYQRAWCVGERSGALKKLIDVYKFEYARAAYSPLSELLLDRVSQLPADTIVVPIPTVMAHIRERGYDHTLLIARMFAKKRRLSMRRVLSRVTSTRQRGASRDDRIAQAKAAFIVRQQLDPSVSYLIIDDIVTTGATVHYAAEALRAAGARDVWIAAIARQPLD